MHDSNTDVSDNSWTEDGCNNEVTDPIVCFKDVPRSVKRWTQPSSYLAPRHDLSIEDGCIAYLGRMLIPLNLQEGCMDSLHGGHPGIPKMHFKAKQSLYWLGINQDIINQAEKCILCQVVARSQKKEPAIPIWVAFRPWQKIGIVLFICKMKQYILVCGCYLCFKFSDYCYQCLVRIWSLPLSLLFQSMAMWKRSSVIMGNRRYEPTFPAVTRAPNNSGVVLSSGRNMLGMMPIPRCYHNSYPSSWYGYRKHPMPAFCNQPQWYLHPVRTLPGDMWFPPQMAPMTSKTGWCCNEEWYLMKCYQCHCNVTSSI